MVKKIKQETEIDFRERFSKEWKAYPIWHPYPMVIRIYIANLIVKEEEEQEQMFEYRRQIFRD